MGRDRSEISLGMKGNFLDMLSKINQQYTPNAAEVAYFDKMTPIIQAMEGNRYGVPSTISTSEADPGFNFQGAVETLKLLDNIRNRNNQNVNPNNQNITPEVPIYDPTYGGYA